MALRLIELFVPTDQEDAARKLLEEHKLLGLWSDRIDDRLVVIRLLLSTEKTEAVLDLLEESFSGLEGFRILLLPVEASIPRAETPEEKSEGAAEAGAEAETEPKVERISREELYTDISGVTKLTKVYVVMAALSSVVAAIGLLRNDVAIIIGAMVIAPLLGPNVALSLATTLGDVALARTAFKANVVGFLTALAVSVAVGSLVTVDPTVSQIASRTRVGLGDIALGLTSGSAGALAFTVGLSTAVIGVMVAVALLPPLVAFGLLAGAGYEVLALKAMLLLVTNLICVNLSGVATFLVQGIRPITWWEADRAKKATRFAMAMWFVLLVVLVAVITLSRSHG